MTERSLTTALVAATKSLLPGSVIFKHNDLHTAGIPDFSVSWQGQTFWVEVKFLRNKHLLSQVLTPIQKETLRKLSIATYGKALIAVYQPGPRAWLLLDPRSGDAVDKGEHDVLANFIVRLFQMPKENL